MHAAVLAMTVLMDMMTNGNAMGTYLELNPDQLLQFFHELQASNEITCCFFSMTHSFVLQLCGDIGMLGYLHSSLKAK